MNIISFLLWIAFLALIGVLLDDPVIKKVRTEVREWKAKKKEARRADA